MQGYEYSERGLAKRDVVYLVRLIRLSISFELPSIKNAFTEKFKGEQLWMNYWSVYLVFYVFGTMDFVHDTTESHTTKLIFSFKKSFLFIFCLSNFERKLTVN